MRCVTSLVAHEKPIERPRASREIEIEGVGTLRNPIVDEH
jgi:hypothetical protein